MSEYVIDATDHVIGEGFDARAFFGPRLKEEIVRCRDCKWFRSADATCHSWQWHNWDAAIEVDSDGFCSWGERRDA